MNVKNLRCPKVLFMPQFVIKSLERNTGSFLPVISNGELHTKLSLNYLAYVFCLDEKIKQILCVESNYDLFRTADKEYALAETLSRDESLKKELDALMNTNVENNVEDTFIIYDTQSNLVCVGIKDGFDTNSQVHQLALVKAVIKHWYMYEKQEVVAQTQLFNSYLKLLSRK